MVTIKKINYMFCVLLCASACKKADGYDPKYDCQQSAACAEEEEGGSVSQEEINVCTDFSASIYENADDETRAELDELWKKCKTKTSCAYVDCIVGS